MLVPARITLALVLLLSCAVAIAGTPAEYLFVPDPEADGAAMLSGSTWTGLGPGFTLRVQRVDEAQRLAFIKKVTGVATDPFATPPGQSPRFIGFLAQLENNGAGSLVFRSQQCWLVTNKHEHLKPIGMASLGATYSVMGGEMSPAYKSVGDAFMPATHTLLPGESMSGLLVYNMFKPSTRRYKLDIQIITPSGDVVPITASYRRIKVKQSGKP